MLITEPSQPLIRTYVRFKAADQAPVVIDFEESVDLKTFRRSTIPQATVKPVWFDGAEHHASQVVELEEGREPIAAYKLTLTNTSASSEVAYAAG